MSLKIFTTRSLCSLVVKKVRLWFFFLCALCTACSSSSSDVQRWVRSDGKIKVMSTTAMIDDIVRGVGGDRVDSIALIVGELDPHSYELVKGDDEKISFAQIIFYNGLGLEHGASLHYALAHHPKSISLGDQVQRAHPDRILYVGKDIDPHIWMDISLWSDIVDPIADALAAVDQEGRELYFANAEALKKKMSEEHESIIKAFSAVPEQKRYLVTSHDAFNYFTRAYLAAPGETPSQWQARFDAPEGLAPEGQLSTADIQKIVEHLLRYRVQCVFPESNVSSDSLKKIVHVCKSKGLAVKISSEVLYGDAMGGKGSGADNYLDMVCHDAEVMIQEWSEEK